MLQLLGIWLVNGWLANKGGRSSASRVYVHLFGYVSILGVIQEEVVVPPPTIMGVVGWFWEVKIKILRKLSYIYLH